MDKFQIQHLATDDLLRMRRDISEEINTRHRNRRVDRIRARLLNVIPIAPIDRGEIERMNGARLLAVPKKNNLVERFMRT